MQGLPVQRYSLSAYGSWWRLSRAEYTGIDAGATGYGIYVAGLLLREIGLLLSKKGARNDMQKKDSTEALLVAAGVTLAGSAA